MGSRSKWYTLMLTWHIVKIFHSSPFCMRSDMLSWSAAAGTSREPIGPSSLSLHDNLIHHDFLSTLRRPYKPCTADASLLSYMDDESNGPFLRPLCRLWRSLDRPDLQSVRNVEMAYLNEQEDQINLAILNLQQEFTVASFVRHMRQPTVAKSECLPFSMFASQLLLYSQIKVELLTIENERDNRRSLLTIDTIWRNTIQSFMQASDCVCKSINASQEMCLRRLIWGECDCVKPFSFIFDIFLLILTSGEAADWPSSALEYAFFGFLAGKGEEHGKRFSSTVSSSPTASLPDGVEMASSLRSETLLGHLSMQPSPISSPQNTLSVDSKDVVSATSQGQTRRPTWSNFWTTDMIELFAADSQVQYDAGIPIDQQTSSPPYMEPAETSSASNEPFDFCITSDMSIIGIEADPAQFWQTFDAHVSIPSAPALSSLGPNITQDSPQSSLRIRPRSLSQADRSKSRAASDRSQRHYMRTKAQRSVLNDLSAALQSLNRTLQSSPSLCSTSTAKLMDGIMRETAAHEKQTPVAILYRSDSGGVSYCFYRFFTY